jgi:hypothetical protein
MGSVTEVTIRRVVVEAVPQAASSTPRDTAG